jgi:beta-phosphoglucomutase-like phosphatase (HAD superfamily)
VNALPPPDEIAAVILDMDGLILDSERMALALLAQSARELGLPWHADVGFAMVGLKASDSERVIRERLGADFPVADLLQAFGDRYEAAIDGGRIGTKPGIRELLDVLDEAVLPRAVATSTRRSRARAKLAAVGLLERFDGMVCGDEVARGKPAPDIFLAAAALLEAAPSSCLVLEDSNAGARGALAAGMRVVIVPDVLAPAADLVAAGTPICSSLHDVAAHLAREAR